MDRGRDRGGGRRGQGLRRYQRVSQCRSILRTRMLIRNWHVWPDRRDRGEETPLSVPAHVRYVCEEERARGGEGLHIGTLAPSRRAAAVKSSTKEMACGMKNKWEMSIKYYTRVGSLCIVDCNCDFSVSVFFCISLPLFFCFVISFCAKIESVYGKRMRWRRLFGKIQWIISHTN